MSDKTCTSLLRKCDCGWYFGKDKEVLKCPHCNKDRKTCSKPRSFKWVKHPET